MGRCLYLDGEMIRQIRKRDELSQIELARRANWSRRHLGQIEHNRSPCSRRMAESLADVLRVSVEALIRTRDVDWMDVPELPRQADAKRLQRAIMHDMEGQHLEAAAICTEILQHLNGTRYPREFAAALIKQVTFLDNASQHVEALGLIDVWLSGCKDRSEAFAGTIHRLRYHRGICLRRLGRFDEARAELQNVRDAAAAPLAVSTLHQIAVVEMEHAKRERPGRPALGRAIRMFFQCLDEWAEILPADPDSSHRRAYPLGRLGEAFALRKETDKAITYYAEALRVFAWHKCKRYSDDAQQAIRELTGYDIAPGPPGSRRSSPESRRRSTCKEL